jgi:hypothetical protein
MLWLFLWLCIFERPLETRLLPDSLFRVSMDKVSELSAHSTFRTRLVHVLTEQFRRKMRVCFTTNAHVRDHLVVFRRRENDQVFDVCLEIEHP